MLTPDQETCCTSTTVPISVLAWRAPPAGEHGCRSRAEVAGLALKASAWTDRRQAAKLDRLRTIEAEAAEIRRSLERLRDLEAEAERIREETDA